MDSPSPEREDKSTKTVHTQSIIDDLTAICNSLGKLDENDGTYMKDRDCKPCLREIQRYLNADAKHHTARCALGSYNIIKSDLIPLLVQYCDFNEGDPELFSTILRLCTNITSSIVLLFKDQYRDNDNINKEAHKILENKILTGLYGYKEAFAESDLVWSTLNTHLRHNRDDDIIFERLIILIRNILHIPVDSTADLGVHSDFDAHDMCLYRMDKSGIMETIIELMSDSQKGSEFCFHLTEILYLMMRDQSPETLAKIKPNFLSKRLDDSDIDKQRLAELSERNRREKQTRTKFSNQLRLKGSSFIVQNIRSISENPLVLNKTLVSNREDIKFNVGKTQVRKAKNKKPLSSNTSMLFSDTNTKATNNSHNLRAFCEQFVKKIYNNYMHQIKHNLIQKKSQENDESYYLWAIQFFTAFCRHSKLSIDLIAETLSTSTLHYIQVLITSYQEKIKIERKEYHDTSKRLHLAIRAYREILILIKENLNSPEYADKINTIKRNVFTENDYTNLLLGLFQQYDEPKHSLHYLEDLIQTNHIFLDVLDDYSAEDSTKSSFLYKYCCPDVIKCYASALKNYKTNKEITNIAILRLFEKIVATENDVVLFQASLFNTLLNIIDYDVNYKILTIKLIGKFGKMANKRRWMFQEILFWKTANDVIEIENAIDPPPAPVIAPPEELLMGDVDGVVSASTEQAGDPLDLDTDFALETEEHGNAGSAGDAEARARAELEDIFGSDSDCDKDEGEDHSNHDHPDNDDDDDDDGIIINHSLKTKSKESQLFSDDDEYDADDVTEEEKNRPEEEIEAKDHEMQEAGHDEIEDEKDERKSELPDGDDIDELKDLLGTQPVVELVVPPTEADNQASDI